MKRPRNSGLLASLLFSLLLLATPVFADFSGPVIDVLDDDTIEAHPTVSFLPPLYLL